MAAATWGEFEPRVTDGIAEQIRAAMADGYRRMFAVAQTPQFRALLRELEALAPRERPAFVANVLLDSQELARRGVVLPDGVLLVRSAFGDRRPTLFCLKVYMPAHLQRYWQNVNLTFDNEGPPAEELAPAIAWRRPLVPLAQAALVKASGGKASAPGTSGELSAADLT